ncbi:DsrE family protein [Mixta calida]|uniref:DsrE family protein n=1 Tax=Mixta calida TaxID=665913 RepID=UPI00290E8A1E|nr:DsrE family protein [Mixta calida]MDU6414604.1 DsrE family protein [Mixta calida]
MKVILHVPDSLRIKNALSNARNILKGMEGQHDIAVVFNADAVSEVLKITVPDDILNAESVSLYLCNNSLIANQIDASTVPESFSIVPAAVVFVLEKQSEGYLYIRP